MAEHRSLVGLFVLRSHGDPPNGGPILARVDGELYLLAFSDRMHALRTRESLGLENATPFYVCQANREDLIAELRHAGAHGFITNYDPSSSTFSEAGQLPLLVS